MLICILFWVGFVGDEAPVGYLIPARGRGQGKSSPRERGRGLKRGNFDVSGRGTFRRSPAGIAPLPSLESCPTRADTPPSILLPPRRRRRRLDPDPGNPPPRRLLLSFFSLGRAAVGCFVLCRLSALLRPFFHGVLQILCSAASP